MAPVDWVAYSVFVAMFALVAWRLRDVWSGVLDPSRTVPTGWLFTSVAWRAAVRASGAGLFVWLLGIVGLPALLLSPERDNGAFARPTGVVVAFLVAFGLGLLAMASVALFNRPRWFVPPPLRAAPGAVAEWRAERSGQRSAGRRR